MAELDLERRELGGSVTIRYSEVASGKYGPVTDAPPLTHAFDYDAGNNMIYFGRAAMGASKAAAVWQIRKFVYASTAADANLLDTLHASGNTNFEHIWNNRAALSYS